MKFISSEALMNWYPWEEKDFKKKIWMIQKTYWKKCFWSRLFKIKVRLLGSLSYRYHTKLSLKAECQLAEVDWLWPCSHLGRAGSLVPQT